MRITNLTFLAFYINGALDSGKYADVTFKEVAGHIEVGSIFTFLEARLTKDIDLSLLSSQDRQELLSEWQGILNAVDARRKFGVEHNGLCLLVAYLLEGIQRRLRSNTTQ